MINVLSYGMLKVALATFEFCHSHVLSSHLDTPVNCGYSKSISKLQTSVLPNNNQKLQLLVWCATTPAGDALPTLFHRRWEASESSHASSRTAPQSMSSHSSSSSGAAQSFDLDHPRLHRLISHEFSHNQLKVCRKQKTPSKNLKAFLMFESLSVTFM